LGSTMEARSRFLVGFHDAPGYAVGDAYDGHRVVAVDEDLRFIVVETSAVDALRLKALGDASVRYLESDESDHRLHLVPNDALWNDPGMYGARIIGAPLAWDVTTGSTAVKVAHIDSGVRRTHEDLAGGRVLQGYDFYNNDPEPDDHTYCFFHGTHTIGTTGATLNNGKGIAGLSLHTILPVKIFQGKSPSFFNGCPTTTTAIVNALKYAADQGSHVSSNSWGGGSFSTAIDDAITYAHNKGTIHVASAGNSGPCTNCVGNPWKAAPTRSIIVSASNQNDQFALTWSGSTGGSSEGPEVDVMAPGDDILSLKGDADNSYRYMDGTSMAAPHVSGVAALVKALNPSFTFADVEARIKGTAVDRGETSDRQGAGRLSASAAVY
ncbi:MAG TPA: S8 family serine peptidase, partial [Candidatus Thermoplasmatota archaeon]|nr:S8 family serine peptidase [Candidatus Thermoplasmatota archaeon]